MTNPQFEISVIMSVYNSSAYLRTAVESILSQTFSDFEFLITDDCSDDDSYSILKAYEAKDKRIRVFRNDKNLGLTVNLNKMTERSNGRYIARMDADDISFPDRFLKQIKLFQKENDTDIVFSDSIYIDGRGHEICRAWTPGNLNKILKSLKHDCYIPHPSVMIKKSVLVENNGYNEKCRTGQDKELWQRLLNNNAVFKYINEPLIYYRINPEGVTTLKKRGNDHDFRLAKVLINNRQKAKALRFFLSNFRGFSFKQKFSLLIKLLLPVRLRYYIAVLRGKKSRFENNNFI